MIPLSCAVSAILTEGNEKRNKETEETNLRIIAGAAKGVRLRCPPHARPTTDRMREALFHILGPFFSGGQVLDLCAGSGSLGLEALSRGMDEAIFVERERDSIQILRHNVTTARLQVRSTLRCCTAQAAIGALGRTAAQQFSLILLDPPYHSRLQSTLPPLIARHALLAPGGRLVVEHTPHLPPPPSFPPHTLSIETQRRYGTTGFTIYRAMLQSKEG